MRSSMWLRARVLKDAAARVACAAVVVASACGEAADDGTTGEGNSATAGPGGAGSSGGSDTATGSNGSGSGTGNGTSGDQGGGGTAGAFDDGGMNGPDTFFRADLLKLLAPKLVTKPLGTTDPRLQSDITGNAQSAVDDSLVQDNEPDDGDGVRDDGDGDGYVDLNAIIRFLGQLDTNAKGGTVTAGAGLCPVPYDPSQACGPLKLGPFQDPAMYTNGQDCKLDGTDKVAEGPCFSSEKGDFKVNIQLIGTVPLKTTQVIGSWVDGGKGGIANGWIRGFLSEEVARQTKLPDQLPLAARLLLIPGGAPLSDFLSDDPKFKQADPPGWWFLLRYTAKPAIFDSSVGPDGEK